MILIQSTDFVFGVLRQDGRLVIRKCSLANWPRGEAPVWDIGSLHLPLTVAFDEGLQQMFDWAYRG